MSALPRLLLACAVAVALTGCGAATTGGSEETTRPGVARGSGGGEQAGPGPSFAALSATTLAGEEFDFGSLAGEPTVLWFWAPWCTICRAEGPEVVATAERLADDVRVIGVPGRGERAAMEQFVSDTGSGGLEHVVDDDGTLWTAFGIVSQPAFAFIDPDGGVEVFSGPLGGEELEATARALTS